MKSRHAPLLPLVVASAALGCAGAPPRPLSLDFPAEPSPAGAAPAAPSGAAGAAARPAQVAGGGLGQREVIPLALRGDIYFLEPSTSKLPDFAAMKPVGTIYTSRLDVTPRAFDSGFPGVTDRFEWFAIDYHGVYVAPASGQYDFRLTSDDGARLWIDGRLVVDNDGVHAPRAVDGSTELTAGPHAIEVQYFQGPRVQIALVLEAALRGAGALEVLDTGRARDIVVRRAQDRVDVTLGGELLFDVDKSDLKPAAEAVLARIKSDLVDARPSARVVVEGHTDDTGEPEHNVELSTRRAQTVARWLEGHGVAPARLAPVGYGMGFPRVPNSSPENRAQNRRVEIVLTDAAP